MSTSSNEPTGEQTNPAHSMLDEIIAQYVSAVERGDNPDREQLLARHAEFADELRDFFEHRDRMESLIDPLRSAAARVLNVRCPHCRNPVELVDDVLASDISCPSCGSQFSLVSDGSARRFPGGLKSVANFRLLDQVGVGQFGSVWKARDTTLERTVAIKIPRNRQLDPDETEMFLRDARAAAQLKHPNIVGVHEVGRHEETIYIVSDFIHGASLKEWTFSRNVTPREAAELIIKVARALHYAHGQGVIHRDLKPGNIMIDLAGEPHIVDFGLAKREDAEITMTLDGQILGSPAYMSPEQARGDAHHVDGRADIYSLGVVLFQLLTGELPFRGEKQMLIVQILSDAPPPPRRLNGLVPRDLETICLKCLRKEPGQRYQSAAALADDLQRWLDRKPIVARPVAFYENAWSWCRRHPTITALIALLAVVLVGSFFTAREVRERERVHRLLAELESADANMVPAIVRQLDDSRKRALPQLESALDGIEPRMERRHIRLNLALLELTRDSQYASALEEPLLNADPVQHRMIRQAMKHSDDYLEELWELAASHETTPGRRFRALCALANFAPRDERWGSVATFAAEQLASVPPQEFAGWNDSLHPVREWLIPPLRDIFYDRSGRYQRRVFAAHSLANYLAEDTDKLFSMLLDSEHDQFAAFFPFLNRNKAALIKKLKQQLESEQPTSESIQSVSAAEHRARASIVAFQVGMPKLGESILRASPDPQARTRFIHWAIPYGLTPKQLLQRIPIQKDDSSKAAIVLALGEASLDSLDARTKNQAVTTIRQLHAEAPSAGLRAATEWLMRRWQVPFELPSEVSTPDRQSLSGGDWFVDQGITMVVLEADEVLMGADESVPVDIVIGRTRPRDRPQQRTVIARKYAIAATEITRQRWNEFVAEFPDMAREAYDHVDSSCDQCPQTKTSWFDAAHFCNWLSQRAGFPESEWAYVPNKKGEYAEGMTTSASFPVCRGYRLPTDAEWEFACRAGTRTHRPFDIGTTFLGEYACCQLSHEAQLGPVASHKPNDFGLYDMLGSVVEWCHDAGHYLTDERTVYDTLTAGEVISDDRRLLRGGTFHSPLDRIDSVDRTWWRPDDQEFQAGFRVARTLQPASHDIQKQNIVAAQQMGREGEWREAAMLLEGLLDAEPPVPDLSVRAETIWRSLGERERAVEVRRKLFDRFGNTNDPVVAHALVQTYLFDFEAEIPAAVDRMCQLTFKEKNLLFKRDLGVLRYRQGEFEAAREILESIDRRFLYAPGRARTLSVLALTYHALGEDALTASTRERFTKLMTKYRSDSSDGDYGEYWPSWLRNGILEQIVREKIGP